MSRVSEGECDKHIKGSLWYYEGGQFPFRQVLDHNPSTRTTSQIAEKVSYTASVLHWSGTQSVLCDHMHISPQFCIIINQTPLCGPGYF